MTSQGRTDKTFVFQGLRGDPGEFISSGQSSWPWWSRKGDNDHLNILNNKSVNLYALFDTVTGLISCSLCFF